VNTARKIINAVRGIPKPVLVQSVIEGVLADALGQQRVADIVQSQDNIILNREAQALRAQIAKVQEQINAEAKRQDEIRQTRIKNLAKARRVQRRMRNG
jgi:hypothetical protein